MLYKFKTGKLFEKYRRPHGRSHGVDDSFGGDLPLSDEDPFTVDQIELALDTKELVVAGEDGGEEDDDEKEEDEEEEAGTGNKEAQENTMGSCEAKWGM